MNRIPHTTPRVSVEEARAIALDEAKAFRDLSLQPDREPSFRRSARALMRDEALQWRNPTRLPPRVWR